jgi:hypothetical protein
MDQAIRQVVVKHESTQKEIEPIKLRPHNLEKRAAEFLKFV